MKKLLITLSLLFTATTSFAADVVKVGIAAEPYPPMSSKNADGSWEGFEIDLLGEVCKEAKLDCQIKEIAWDGIIPALLSKKIDVIFTSMSVTEERAKKVLFTKPYYNTLPAVIGLPNQKFAFDKETLKRKIIGVQTSTISAFYIKEKVGKFAEIREYGTQDEVNADLLAGRIDFMMADAIPAVDFYEKNKSLLENYGGVKHEPILGEGVAAAVRHGDTALEGKFSTAIDTLVKSDTYTKLSMNYFQTNIAPE
ncbi:transporter substrate-binding domain-containing protein [Vibrio hippocampi]|uniref:Lysine/arginine/ornithine-binding periplasmic protein n=1 Tax=Vibrio hippocampi TaxID=654686 RepID=A0ABN8DKQ9_9VIBR|nr:transporter substrate-binding domain-containing protein [Vibrio hippocampi]CAH0529867.1 Lysine/arginine/ornithine-binding periplasmic protein [Vibrio hippocampi]